MEYGVKVVAVGIGATLVSDLWGWLRRPLAGVPAPDYRMVGRWIGHVARGRVRHDRIAAATEVRGERLLGWSAHYLIGIVFAFGVTAVAGPSWLVAPSLPPALLVGAITLLAPFLILQPGMGAGIFARRAPRPWTARLHSFLLHIAFGFGLYLAARLVASLPLTAT
jgi:hypothetical protein